MKDILISVCTVTYNHGKYIADAIEGVLMQQCNYQIEMIIGDDCSTDSTTEIVKSYQQRYPEIIKPIFHNPNVGAQANSFACLKDCKGKYIAALEGDDYWTDPLKLQKQVDFLELNPEYSICFHRVGIDNGSSIVDDYITKVPANITSQTDLLVKGNYIHTPSMVFRNSSLTLPEWMMRAMPGDYPLYLILTNNGEKIKYLDAQMANYRVHQQGIWSMQNTNKYLQHSALTMLNCAKYLKHPLPEFISRWAMVLADSVYYLGYQKVTKAEYFSLIRWALSRAKFSPKQLLYMLLPTLRRRLKNPPKEEPIGQ